MRWVFYSLLILNLVFLAWNLVDTSLSGGKSTVETRSVLSVSRSLTLLSEVRGAQPGAGHANLMDEHAQLCPAIGPWGKPGRAVEALGVLRAAGYQGEVRSIQIEQQRLHWVYLPPFESRAAALDVLRELHSRGVDSFVVAEGEYRNAISLGYFESEESARGLRSRLKTAGYPAQIRETSEVITEYWVYLARSSIGDHRQALQDFLAAHGDVMVNMSGCAAVADATTAGRTGP